jgi:hypothetical protein
MTLCFAGHFSNFAQDAIKTNNTKHTTNFTDVQCLQLINYSHGLSSGLIIYPKYSIKKRKTDFLIEADLKNNNNYSWAVPYSNREITKKGNKDKSKSKHYISEKQTYKVNDRFYIIYKHISYNCYDPFCATKHNHISSITGETYFSPEYGIIFSVDNQNLIFNLMTKIAEKKIPYDLIIQILAQRKTDIKIIEEYISKVK